MTTWKAKRFLKGMECMQIGVLYKTPIRCMDNFIITVLDKLK